MFIQKFLLFILTAGLLVSCSKDDGPVNPSQAKARLSIRMQLRSQTESKAAESDKNALPGESDIHNLSAYVFSSDGSALIGYGRVDNPDPSSLMITNIETKPERIRLVILANLPENIDGTVADYAALQSQLAALTSQTQESLTFSTPVIQTQEALLEGEDNLIGYTTGTNVDNISIPLYLTRIAARVEMNTIETDFAGSLLEGKTVRIDHITLANVKSNSYYFSEEDWGKVEVPFAQAGLVYGTEVSEADSLFVAGSSPVGYLGQDFNLTINDKKPLLTPVFEAYAFENSATDTSPTLIVIKATLVENNLTRLFTSPINRNGVSIGYDHNYMKRNYIYRLHITFTGDSFRIDPDDPEPPVQPNDTSLNVRVEVVNWGYVHQTEEI